MGSLSSVLKQRRQELGLTLLQIAEMVGVTEATVQRWESGNIKNVRLEKVGKLAEILQVSPAALMGWAEPVEEKQPASGRGELSPSEEDLIHLWAGDHCCGKVRASARRKLGTAGNGVPDSQK